MSTEMLDEQQIEQLLETNPEAIDVNDPRVMAIINKLSGGEEPAAGDDSAENAAGPGEGDGDAAAKAAEEKAAQEAAEAAAKAAGKPVILSKDGKHTMPYDVLERERDDKDAATAAARQLAAVVQALEEENSRLRRGGGDGGEEGKAAPAVHPVRAQLDAALKQVEEISKEYPDLAPAQKAILDALTSMGENLYAEVERQRGTIAQLERVATQTVHDKQSAVKETVQDSLAKVPALVVWRTKAPDLFKLATQFDNTLKNDEAWKGKPMVDRFNAAVQMVVAARGPQVLDGIAPAQDKTPESPKKPPVSASAAIAAALGISSLSDIPGGSPVSQVPGAVDGLSDSQLAEKLAGMDDAALIAFISGAVT